MYKSNYLCCHVVGISTGLLEFINVSYDITAKTKCESTKGWVGAYMTEYIVYTNIDHK